MSLYNTTSIKELPQLEEIINGDYLIVENEQGTHILDFVDFVVGPENVSFYSTVTTLCSRSISMSATVDQKVQALSADYYTRISEASASNLTTTKSVSSNIITIIRSVSSTVYPSIFYTYPENIVIPVGGTSDITQFSCPINTIDQSDVSIVPTNFSSASAAWYISLSYVSNPSYPEMPFTYTLTLQTNRPISLDPAVFKVKVMKHYFS